MGKYCQGGFKEKTKGFAELAVNGSIDSFRKIEKILSDADLANGVRDFGLVALNFCRFKIENDLLDEPVDMISGGLGGTENKMRCFSALEGKNEITQAQFLKPECYLTNVEIPSADQILSWMAGDLDPSG